MNQEARDILNKILNISVNELTSFHIAFLKARREYLTKEQVEKYQIIFDDFVSKPMLENSIDTKGTSAKTKPISELSYTDILLHARKVGYKGKRKTKEELLDYIAKHS